MGRVFRVIKRIFLYLFVALLLLVIGIGIFSASFNWQGVCAHPDGTQTACSRLQFGLQETFWALFLFIPYFFVAGIVYLLMSLAQFVVMVLDKLRTKRTKKGVGGNE